MEVEAGRAPEQQPPAALVVCAGLAEQPVELDEPRVDEEGAAGGEVDLLPLQPERVLEHGRRALERVAAARHPRQHVPAAEHAAAVLPDEHLDRSDPAHLVDDQHVRGLDPRVDVQLEDDRHVLPLEVLDAGRDAPQLHRPVEQPHPGPRERDREEEADRDRVQRQRPEGPAGDVQPEAEKDGDSAARGQHGG